MIAGKKYDGLLVDIWSCGIILYAMLCGYLPFEDPDTTELYKKILKGEFELPDFLSDNAKDMLKKVMNTDPEIRYKIPDIRKHPWYSLARAEKVDEGILVGYQQIPLDRFILSELQKYDIDPEYGRKCLEANRHNEVTTTYNLLIKKYKKEGKNGVIDPSSSLCLQRILSESLKKTVNSHENSKTIHEDNDNTAFICNALESLNTDNPLGLCEMENCYSDNVKRSAEIRSHSSTYEKQPDNESSYKTSDRFEQLFAKLKFPKNSKQYAITSKLPPRSVNKTHHIDMIKDNIRINQSLNDNISPKKDESSLGIFPENGGNNGRLQRIYDIYKKVVGQAKARQSDSMKFSGATKKLKIPHPPIDPRKIQPSIRQNKFLTKDFSPYITKLNTSVRPTSKSQNKKKTMNITVRKATSHIDNKNKKIPLYNDNELTPITIIQAPLINTYNNYNSFNIGNFSLGHIEETNKMNKPLGSNFRKRKYNVQPQNKNKTNLSFA